MSITKQIEKQIENDPIFAELYEQHIQSQWNRSFQKIRSVQEQISSFMNESSKDKKIEDSYNKLQKI